MLETPPK